MKKTFIALSLLTGLFLASCENQHPEISICSLKLIMYVGESAVVKVDYANKEVNYNYSDTRNTESPVFEISDFEGQSTTITALNPGTDTLWIGYRYTRGAFAYGNLMPMQIIALTTD